MRWTILVCTAGTYVILLLALTERQVSAGADRLYRTSVSSIDGNAFVTHEATALSRNTAAYFLRKREVRVCGREGSANRRIVIISL